MSAGWRVFPLLAGLALHGAAAAPSVQNVTDSAGYGPRVAPGSLASIFGENLSTATVSASGFPLPTSLGGATVSLGGAAAPLLYASAGQINFQVPSSVAAGAVGLTVTTAAGTSASFSVTVTSSAPAIFQYGADRALAQNTGAMLNGTSNAAAAGSVVTVYLTGIGAVNNAVPDGAATPLSPLSSASATATATIGALSATVQFLGLTPDFAGLAQANITVPALPNGDYPLVITVGGYLSASAVISVSGSGTPYASPLQLTGSVAFPNSSVSSVALYNNVAYVCGANRVEMIDVTNPAAPAVIGEFGDSVLNGEGDRCAINLTVTNPYLVVIVGASTNPESFAVYGLGDPKSPNLLGVTQTSYGDMVDLSFNGNIGYTTTSYITYYTSSDQISAQNGDFLEFDFSNPGQPAFLGILQPTGQPGSGDQNLKPYAQVVDQVYAYIASSTATGSSTSGTAVLDVVNLATPGAPLAINQIAVGQAAIFLSFDVSGNTLLAAGNTSGQRNPGTPDFDFTGNLTLTTMDLGNILAPNPIETFTSTLQVNGTFHVSAFSNGVFALINNPPTTDDFGPSMLMIVNARAPSAIVVEPYQIQFGFSGLLTTNNGFLLAPTFLGLNIYQLRI